MKIPQSDEGMGIGTVRPGGVRPEPHAPRIAAPGPGSALIHLGINIDPRGAPVPAAGLGEMGLDAAGLLQGLLERYRIEFESIRHATTKVRPVP